MKPESNGLAPEGKTTSSLRCAIEGSAIYRVKRLGVVDPLDGLADLDVALAGMNTGGLSVHLNHDRWSTGRGGAQRPRAQ